MSVSKENFVKTIFQLREDARQDPVSGRLAAELDVSGAAITDMARKLDKEGLVRYRKYAPLELTSAGRTLAVDIIRKHRLWESFLYHVMHIPLEHVHKEAENLEHQTTAYLMAQMEKQLGHPRFDPHGDPIPDKNGVFPERSQEIPLSEAEIGQKYRIVRVYIRDADLLAYMEENGISVQKEVTPVKYLQTDDTIILKVNNRNILLSSSINQNVFVSKMPLNFKNR